MHRPTIEHRPTAMTEHKASEVVAKLNADTEDDWTYKVFECVATGLFYVSTHDEDGIFVGNL